jgi:hypothetical protein
LIAFSATQGLRAYDGSEPLPDNGIFTPPTDTAQLDPNARSVYSFASDGTISHATSFNAPSELHKDPKPEQALHEQEIAQSSTNDGDHVATSDSQDPSPSTTATVAAAATTTTTTTEDEPPTTFEEFLRPENFPAPYPQSSIWGIAFWQERMYFSDQDRHQILVSSNVRGAPRVIAGTGVPGYSGDGGRAERARFHSPNGIAFDSLGNLFVADYHNHCIRMIERQHQFVSTVVGQCTRGTAPDQSDLGDLGHPLKATLRHAYTIAFDSRGRLYIADYDNYRIRRVNQALTQITTFHNLLTLTVPAIAIDQQHGDRVFYSAYGDEASRIACVEQDLTHTILVEGEYKATTTVSGSMADLTFRDPLSIAVLPGTLDLLVLDSTVGLFQLHLGPTNVRPQDDDELTEYLIALSMQEHAMALHYGKRTPSHQAKQHLSGIAQRLERRNRLDIANAAYSMVIGRQAHFGIPPLLPRSAFMMRVAIATNDAVIISEPNSIIVLQRNIQRSLPTTIVSANQLLRESVDFIVTFHQPVTNLKFSSFIVYNGHVTRIEPFVVLAQVEGKPVVRRKRSEPRQPILGFSGLKMLFDEPGGSLPADMTLSGEAEYWGGRFLVTVKPQYDSLVALLLAENVVSPGNNAAFGTAIHMANVASTISNFNVIQE